MPSMRFARPPLPALVFLALATLVGACVTGRSKRSNRRGLASPDLVYATKAFEALFDAGETSVPFLLDRLFETSPFAGLCGSAILESSSRALADDQQVESLASGAGSRERCPTVGEVALYLLVAIQRDDRYFARRCSVEPVDPRAPYSISMALGAIAEAYTRREGERGVLSVSEIERILYDSNLHFPGARGPD